MNVANHLDVHDNQLFKVRITHKQWFSMGIRIMNVANHLYVHD